MPLSKALYPNLPQGRHTTMAAPVNQQISLHLSGGCDDKSIFFIQMYVFTTNVCLWLPIDLCGKHMACYNCQKLNNDFYITYQELLNKNRLEDILLSIRELATVFFDHFGNCFRSFWICLLWNCHFGNISACLLWVPGFGLINKNIYNIPSVFFPFDLIVSLNYIWKCTQLIELCFFF